MAIGNGSIFLHTVRYNFKIIICLRIFGSAKRGDRTLMGRSRPKFQPKLESIYYVVESIYDTSNKFAYKSINNRLAFIIFGE